MALQFNTKIQPLLEDVRQILSGEFLKSTGYKRWLVEQKLDELWAQLLHIVETNRSFYELGYDHEAADSKDTLSCLINTIFENHWDKLPTFLFELLSFYAKVQSENIDVADIKKDLLAAGFSPDQIAVLERIPTPNTIIKKKEIEQTQEQKVRSLEREYLTFREKNSGEAIDAYLEWHSAALLYLSNYYTEANHDYAEFKHIDNSGNGYVLRNNFKLIYSKYNLLMNNVTNQEKLMTANNGKKTPLVFISHSHCDKDFVIALVNLLDDMGFTQDTLFCSSVREYGIPLNGDIFETIRNLFLEHDLYVIFVHSPRFYGSAVSLNEMGAAWVLKSDFCSILTSDMDYGKMKGVVNNAKLSIKVDEEEAKGLLNDLYKHLISVFSLQEMNMNKWERKRDQFLQVVTNLKYDAVEDTIEENAVDMEYKKFQIAKMKSEAEAKSKAIIRGNIVKGLKGEHSTLKIFNAGASTAHNVRVEWLNGSSDVLVRGNFSEIGDLTPQNSRSYILNLIIGHPETMHLRYSWDDDFAKGNQIEESLQL